MLMILSYVHYYFPLFLFSYLLVLVRCSFHDWMTWPFLLVFAALYKLQTSSFLTGFPYPILPAFFSRPRPHEHDEKNCMVINQDHLLVVIENTPPRLPRGKRGPRPPDRNPLSAMLYNTVRHAVSTLDFCRCAAAFTYSKLAPSQITESSFSFSRSWRPAERMFTERVPKIDS